MSVDPRSPCIVGVAQHVHRPEDGPSPEPLDLWELVVRAAVDDAQSRTGDVLSTIESLQIVYCQSWQYDDATARLADRLGIDPRHRYYSGIGGTTPQVLVDDAARSIVDGDCDVAVVCGAEALDTVRRMKKAGERPQWSYKPDDKRPFPFEAPFHPVEIAHEVFQAYTTFALWDVARRAHLGIPPDEYRRQIGELFAPMSAVAAHNPYAWFPVERSATELVEATPDNRMVAYPYTKYVISVMDVDLSAALVLMSHEAADRHGIPADRRVYVRGWCYATDPVYVAEHDPTWASPAMKAASGEALRSAGLGIDDVAHLDLYSCFPSSVAFALDALGLDPSTDSRAPFTVTGGLPYFGGAGSDYVTHSIAQMVDTLRAHPDDAGMCSGVGMHMTKHVYGVYSTEPPPSGPPRPDEAAAQPELQPRAITDTYSGRATVRTYTVLHGRDGAPDWGLVVCDLDDGSRCYGRTRDRALLDDLERDECVGRSVDLVTGEGNVNEVVSWAS